MSERFTLPMWVVYDHPSDCPDFFVARRWEGETATGSIVMSTDLEKLRDTMQQMGLVKLDRFDDDDPVILETWL